MRASRNVETETLPPRRRKASAGVIGTRLAVAEDKLDFDRFAYRWINDKMARISGKYAEDWDVVQNDGSVKEDSADLGNAVSAVVGLNPDGSKMLAYLCRKPKTYFDEDQRDKMAALDEQLTQLRSGTARDAETGEAQSDYVRGMRISR
jgi:hypothetical protein